MHKNKYTITFRQYIFLIFGAQVGVGILQLPRALAEKAGMDGWLSIISGYIISVISSLIMVQIMKKHPDASLPAIFNIYLEKWGGKFGTLLLLIYFLFLSFVVIQRSILFIKIWIIPGTTEYVLMLLISLPLYIIVSKGIHIIGRYAELIAVPTISSLIFYVFALKESHHWNHLLPVFHHLKESLLNTSSTIMSFLGMEFVFFLYPFLQKKHLASRGVIIANSLTMLLMLFITLSCFLFYSPDEITQYNEPTLSMLKVVEFRFLERVEIIFLSLFIFIMSTTWICYIYCSASCMCWLTNQRNYTIHIRLFLATFIMVIYFLNSSLYQNDILQSISNKLGLIFVYIFPPCFWIYIKICKHIQWRRLQ